MLRLSSVVAVGVLALTGGVAAPAAAAPGAVAARLAVGDDTQPVRIVIAVDESGSLAPADVLREREAATIIALGELSPKSSITIFGFGSSTGGGRAVDARQCMLKPDAPAADRDAMAACIREQINRRTEAEGHDTDFVAALSQGITLLKGFTDDAPRVLLLMTDGKLNVANDSAYGSDADSRRRAAEALLTDEVLPSALANKIQIWPLGFGTDIDADMLKSFAAGGAKASCAGVARPDPVFTPVPDKAALVQAMLDVSATARCAVAEPGVNGELPAGGEVDLTVEIPLIATDGSISVVKGDPSVKVTYFDPQDKQVKDGDNVDRSSFTLSGHSGAIESMRIRNPRPGRWRVHLAGSASVAKQVVSASVLWQGVLKSVIYPDPPSPAAGSRFSVKMRPQTREDVEITNASALAGLTFEAHLKGGGVDQTIQLHDDGQEPDRQAGDAYYGGSFALPANASGTLTLAGIAKGPGVATDRHEISIEIATGPPVIRATVVVDSTTVYPGESVTGKVLLANDGAAAPIRLELASLKQSGSATLTPAGTTAAPGSSEIAFTVAVGKDAELGPLGGAIQVIGADGKPIQAEPLAVIVVAVPTFWDRWWWAIVAVAALVLLALAWLGIKLIMARRERGVGGLVLKLYENGHERKPTIAPGPAQAQAEEFEFDIRVPDDGGVPSLQTVSPGTNRYRLRRAGAGKVALRVPTEETLTFPLGQQTGLPHVTGLWLLVEDVGRGSDDETTVPPPPPSGSVDLDL
ncbi:hypothetical protein F4553_006529 [Allocatelliglobosispora scoriae]|uniref:VWFA domain-containing protein n=1 Tax=Allocatelliglobosispora scoriae TaxID=643052 RepID=A0A841BZI3_9ACTN|nr:vWA domain-containing protein [Allocatelliglobosispora scoriae]MBB5873095.1 hypothetical protein [Allocatelliglobosispora scoriae]